MTEPTSTAEPAEKEREESFWSSLNRADMKLLMLTFAGTAAANVVTVVVVGLGLLVVRLAHDQHAGFVGLLIVSAYGAAGAIVVLTPVLLVARRTRRRASDIAGNVAFALMVAVYLFAAIGYLAGVK